MAAQAILTELLARLARLNPEMRAVTSSALEAAAVGLEIVAREDGDAYRRRVLARAAVLVAEIYDTACGCPPADVQGGHSRH